MSGSVDALGWWAIVQNDGNYDGPSPPLFSANPLLKQIMQSKKGLFNGDFRRNAEAVGAATATWAWQGGRAACRRGEDDLLKLGLSVRIGTERGLKWLWMWDELLCWDFHSQPVARVYRQWSGREEMYRRKKNCNWCRCIVWLHYRDIYFLATAVILPRRLLKVSKENMNFF